MPRTLEVIFDGQVFRPDTPPDLEPNTRCTIFIQAEVPAQSAQPPGETAWDVLHRLAGTVEAPEDWALEHDHYIHGTPKRAHIDGPPEA